MWWVEVRALEGDPSLPVRYFSEVGPDGLEVRRVEVFANGSMSFAGLFAGLPASCGDTVLSPVPLATPDEVSLVPGFEASRLSRQAFDEVWWSACASVPPSEVFFGVDGVRGVSAFDLFSLRPGMLLPHTASVSDDLADLLVSEAEGLGFVSPAHQFVDGWHVLSSEEDWLSGVPPGRDPFTEVVRYPGRQGWFRVVLVWVFAQRAFTLTPSLRRPLRGTLPVGSLVDLPLSGRVVAFRDVSISPSPLLEH